MAETTMEMTPQQLATAMSNRVVRERRRIAQRVEEFIAAHPKLDDQIGGELYALADEIRGGVNVGAVDPVVVEAQPQRPLADNDPGDGLPPIREMNDFDEGVALVQGGRFRSGVTGRLNMPTD